MLQKLKIEIAKKKLCLSPFSPQMQKLPTNHFQMATSSYRSIM
jgi:hypothetical protein